MGFGETVLISHDFVQLLYDRWNVQTSLAADCIRPADIKHISCITFDRSQLR